MHAKLRDRPPLCKTAPSNQNPKETLQSYKRKIIVLHVGFNTAKEEVLQVCRAAEGSALHIHEPYDVMDSAGKQLITLDLELKLLHRLHLQNCNV